MPSKKSPFVFSNAIVINGEQKPVKPVMRPVVIVKPQHKNLNIKYK